jgi:hypothetical protein
MPLPRTSRTLPVALPISRSFDHPVLLERVDHRERRRAGDRITAKG